LGVQVSFHIDATKAPPNSVSTSGQEGYDPAFLDRHEWDGHLIVSMVEDDGIELSIPFHMLLRQAAAPQLVADVKLPATHGPVDQNWTITNHGAGIAQIDAFDLIYSDIDDEEAPYGVERVAADVRSIGYRTVKTTDPDCDYLVEFSVQSWERTHHVGAHTYRVDVFPNSSKDPLTIWLPELPAYSESYIIDRNRTSSSCTGLRSDHSGNTANTIFRVCSKDLELTRDQEFDVRIRALGFPTEISTVWESQRLTLPFPETRLSAASYDLAPGETLTNFHVTGTIGRFANGLQLVTNAFRSWNRTGASTAETETILVVKEGIVLAKEKTPDVLTWPVAVNRTGPPCGWVVQRNQCVDVSNNVRAHVERVGNDVESTTNQVDVDTGERVPTCPPIEITRLKTPTHVPSSMPSNAPTAPTSSPILFPPEESPSSPASRSDLRQVMPLCLLFALIGLALW